MICTTQTHMKSNTQDLGIPFDQIFGNSDDQDLLAYGFKELQVYHLNPFYSTPFCDEMPGY